MLKMAAFAIPTLCSHLGPNELSDSDNRTSSSGCEVYRCCVQLDFALHSTRGHTLTLPTSHC